MIQLFDLNAIHSLLSSFATVGALAVVVTLLVSYSGLVGNSIHTKMAIRARTMPGRGEEIENRNRL